MQPHTRSHESYTYDIADVVEVDETALTFAVRAIHRVALIRFHLAATGLPIDGQLFRGCLDSLAVRGNGGRWSSAETLVRNTYCVKRFRDELLSAGIQDLSDPTMVTLRALRDCVGEFDASAKRMLTFLLARVVKAEGHPDSQLPARLKNSKFVADNHEARDTYTDEEIDAVEKASRAHLVEIVEAQRRILGELGYGDDLETFETITAGEIISAASGRDRRRTQPMEGASQPLSSATRVEQLDWALLNPHRYHSAHQSRRQTPMDGLLRVFYPTVDVLLAGLAVHCLADNTGANLSVLLREPADNFQPTGDHTGQVGYAKARNSTIGKRSVRRDGMFSAGGITVTMSAITRFLRHHRTDRLRKAGVLDEYPELAARIYVKDHRDLAKTTTMEHVSIASAARRGRLANRLEQVWPEGGRPTIRMSALRSGALVRGLKLDPEHDVVDHTTATRVDYLANALPDVDLHRLVTAAQDDLHSNLRDAYADPDAARRLAEAAAKDQLMDLGPLACTNNARDPGAEPDDTSVESWCTRGLAACFVCPNGYRTLDHAPALLALEEYTELIGRGNPHEWVDGDAAVLHYYAVETLRQFPRPVVERARGSMDREMDLLDIHMLYTEARRG